jgi:hypothetical protein
MMKHCATTGCCRYADERPGKVKAPLAYLFQLLEWAIAYWDIGIKSRTKSLGLGLAQRYASIHDEVGQANGGDNNNLVKIC